ncbi:hypothetical protein MMC12_004500 [Toensbergia leucococca]|nr:hypothetical protein [Toensbergia leucococca]
MSQSSSSERWVLLDGPVSSDYVPSILGCVVAYPRQPTKAFFPSDDARNDGNKPVVTTEVVKDLYDRPISFTDLESIKQCAQDGKARVKLTSILDAHASTQTKNFVKYSANEVMRYDMPNPKTKIQRLWENADYREGVTQMWKENVKKSPHGLPMVTGILVCKKMSLVRTNDNTWGAWLKSKIPATQILGDYSSLFASENPEISLERSKSAGTNLSYHIDEEVIFALAYDTVYLKQEIEKRHFLPHHHHSKAKNSSDAASGSPEPRLKIVLGDQVRGDVGYFSDDKERGDSEVEGSAGEEAEYDTEEESEATAMERRKMAFVEQRAVITCGFADRPDNVPDVVDIAGEVPDVEHVGNGSVTH